MTVSDDLDDLILTKAFSVLNLIALELQSRSIGYYSIHILLRWNCFAHSLINTFHEQLRLVTVEESFAVCV